MSSETSENPYTIPPPQYSGFLGHDHILGMVSRPYWNLWRERVGNQTPDPRPQTPPFLSERVGKIRPQISLRPRPQTRLRPQTSFRPQTIPVSIYERIEWETWSQAPDHNIFEQSRGKIRPRTPLITTFTQGMLSKAKAQRSSNWLLMI